MNNVCNQWETCTTGKKKKKHLPLLFHKVVNSAIFVLVLNENSYRMVDLCFEKCVPSFKESPQADKGEEGFVEYLKWAVAKYMEVQRIATQAFSSQETNA